MTLIRFCFAMTLALAGWLAATDAFAQANRNGDDQPGLIANADDEQLDPKWQKTVVFYRTTEAPGTIIVQSDQRYLYVVQPGGRALRYGIGLTATLAGLDKFFNLLANWSSYVSPLAARVLPVSTGSFMHIVGVIELAVGLVILAGWTRLGAYVASAWLTSKRVLCSSSTANESASLS